ncbi:hypothetical protein, partial [Salmonella sp. s51228]|uniref:hypothetical protein n=1 Tax=Salmonella sp. s51228 TaxID=3159652 RepID=UPI00397ECE68
GTPNRNFRNDAAPESSNRLKISNLNYETNYDTLSSIFNSAVDVFIVKDKESGESRGFGFVEFSSVDEAKKMMKKNTGKKIDGRDIRLEFAGERPSPGGQSGGRGSFGRGRGGNSYGNRGSFNSKGMRSGAIQEYAGTKKKFGSRSFNYDSD